jgi:hypothetical protein
LYTKKTKKPIQCPWSAGKLSLFASPTMDPSTAPAASQVSDHFTRTVSDAAPPPPPAEPLQFTLEDVATPNP